MIETLTTSQVEALKRFQKNEITEYHIYTRLAKVIKNRQNAEVLERIGNEEKRHYEIWKTYTGADVEPKWRLVRWYVFIARTFGITFGIKLMERGEAGAQKGYARFLGEIPESKKIMEEEHEHEEELIAMIDEERLQYAGSIVLGLNDALVELTGALAGFSLAMKNTRLIAMAGLISGIAAGFSMAAADYLSKKAEQHHNAARSATYTGVAYLLTLALLIFPYLVFSNYLLCLIMTLAIAILIIFGFNYYISVAKDLNFKQRFAEMTIISLGVAALTFGVGFLIKKALGIDI